MSWKVINIEKFDNFDYKITVEIKRLFRKTKICNLYGSGTVWHHDFPHGRCNTETELWLSDRLTQWKRHGIF